MTARLLRRGWVRAALVLPLLGAAVALLWWRGPDWSTVVDAFTVVHWWWIVAAIALNLASVVARSLSWNTAIHQALPPPRPPYTRVFSAFAVGLLANAVLPGRVGELARVAVLTRRLPGGSGATATLLGTVFAHRLFDVIPSLLLIAYVVMTAKIPHWAILSLGLVAGIGSVLFAAGIVSARLRHHVSVEAGTLRRLLSMARRGLGVMRSPLPAVVAVLFQCIGWFLQLVAVYVAMRAFGIDAPLPAAGLVLLLMNVATVFPLWPGNIGLLQAAVALPLVSYGVAYARGFAYGLGLQVIEMSVGVGVGLLFLAREGLSFATLRRMEAATEAEAAEIEHEELEADAAGPRARVPG
ncbi:MAG: flippase-like domain-containing protein [Actinomycetota bacterium]|nr:flippase-like domain-containing protein [Actinomycetota bacterium]